MPSGASTSTRRRLDRDAVEAAAEAIVDRDGWERLTMSGLARELGIKVPSLYNHVPNLEALLGVLQVRAMRDLASELRRAAMGTVGADAIRSLGDAHRSFARQHPGRYEFAMREPIDRRSLAEASAEAGEALSAVIASFGVEQPSLELMVTCTAAVHGVVALENAGLYRGIIDSEAVHRRMLDLVVLLLEHEATTTGTAPAP